MLIGWTHGTIRSAAGLDLRGLGVYPKWRRGAAKDLGAPVKVVAAGTSRTAMTILVWRRAMTTVLKQATAAKLLLVGVLCCGPYAVADPPSLEGLGVCPEAGGNDSWAYAITPDGKVVVGYFQYG